MTSKGANYTQIEKSLTCLNQLEGSHSSVPFTSYSTGEQLSKGDSLNPKEYSRQVVSDAKTIGEHMQKFLHIHPGSETAHKLSDE